MKVFFSTSRRGREYFEENYNKIFKFIKDEGYENINNELIEKDNDQFYEELKKSGPKAYGVLYNKLLDGVKHADICIFECSLQSLTMGFLIQKALELSKPVIALYLEDHRPDLLAGIKEEKFQLIEYSPTNLSDKLLESIKNAKLLADKRFNFFINPTLLNYLYKASKEQGITKSTFIRYLILEHMKKNSLK
ncbi:MAG: hypothetical protein Q7S61_05855 [bacterium]|nr:hypothetical protein [bacterium]